MEKQSMRAKTMDLINEQLARSRNKYPGNEHLLTAALESLGRLAKAMLCGEGPRRAEKEAAQVCAILARLIEEGDATFQDWPPNRGDAPR